MVRTLAALGLTALFVLAGCSPTEEGAAPAGRPDDTPLIRGPVSPTGLQAILGTGDLAVGENRVGFVLVTPQRLVNESETQVTSFYYPSGDDKGEPRETVTAEFRLWPYGTRGLYATWLTFDQPGRWGLEIAVDDGEGSRDTTQLFFPVLESPATPRVGGPAPPSASKTIDDVAELRELTTGSLGDPELYGISIADAVRSGRPSVVVFASPAFCINEVCGPQVETVQQLKERHKGRANFVHVDLYDNPHEIQGDLRRARFSPAVLEWGLPSIEWTFVIDHNGRIAAKFEAFATLEELEAALLLVLT